MGIEDYPQYPAEYPKGQCKICKYARYCADALYGILCIFFRSKDPDKKKK